MRPRLSPWATVPRIWNGAPRKRWRDVHLAGRDQAPDVRRGDDLPVETRPARPRASRTRPARAAARCRPWPCCRSGSSPPRRPCGRRAARRARRSMNSWALCWAKEPSNGITTSSRTARSAMRSALTARGVSSFGAESGATTKRGCGSKVSTVSAPRMTSRWPMCTPSNSPTARWRSRGRASGSQGLEGHLVEPAARAAPGPWIVDAGRCRSGAARQCRGDVGVVGSAI